MDEAVHGNWLVKCRSEISRHCLFFLWRKHNGLWRGVLLSWIHGFAFIIWGRWLWTGDDGNYWSNKPCGWACSQLQEFNVGTSSVEPTLRTWACSGGLICPWCAILTLILCWFRIQRPLFLHIMQGVGCYDVYFKLLKIQFFGLQECMASMSILVYGTTANSWD